MMQIYGIDISSAHLDIHSQDKDEKPFVRRIGNSFKSICKFPEQLPKDSVLCAEHTGVYRDLLVHLANSYGFKMALIEGYVISKSFANEKAKTDPVDARKIWNYGIRFYDQLRFAGTANTALHEIKELLGLRNQLVKQSKMLKTISKGKQKQVFNAIKVGQTQQKIISLLTQQIKELEQQISQVIAQDTALEHNYKLRRSVNGLESLISAELIAHTENFTKISDPKKAAAFAGVWPYPHQSGKYAKKPKVAKRSNKRLKSLLYLAALSMCQHNKEFKRYKERKIMEGKHFFLVMNNVANKILRILFAVIKSGQPYDPMYVRLDPREEMKN
jgi:transposase